MYSIKFIVTLFISENFEFARQASNSLILAKIMFSRIFPDLQYINSFKPVVPFVGHRQTE